MTGVWINVAAILAGSFAGLLFRKALSKLMTERIEWALGFCTLVIGLKMAWKFESLSILLGCLCIGAIIGTVLKIQDNTDRFAAKVEKRLGKHFRGQFAKAFSISSILYCTGAMAVVGSINSGVYGDHEVLIMKSLLDGIISISLASIYGIGVAFSALPVLIYQGSIALLAPYIEALRGPEAVGNISGVGGILVMMIGITLAGIKKIPVGDFLPAILLVILVQIILFAI